jgi:hypothetical protein
MHLDVAASEYMWAKNPRKDSLNTSNKKEREDVVQEDLRFLYPKRPENSIST